jgi:hypothetical protein
MPGVTRLLTLSLVERKVDQRLANFSSSADCDRRFIFVAVQVGVTKAILNREGYLNRLFQCVKTVNKKFKVEVAVLLDLVRAASLDVIECIISWREAKVR